MITSLRKKVRPDNLTTQVRSGGKSVARRVYLGLVFVLLSLVFYYTVGGLFFLEAKGLVMTDRTIVASLYNARVVDIDVKPGERVDKGALLLTLQAPDLLVELGRHTSRLGDILRRDSQIQARLLGIDGLKPQAVARRDKAEKYENLTEGAEKKGFANSAHVAGTARAYFEASKDLALIEAEESSLLSEAKVQSQLREEAESLINELKAIYDQGDVHAPTGGRVGARIPYAGQVVRTGDPLLEILRGAPYVLAYLPTGRAYSISDGDRVIVTDGTHRIRGTVERSPGIADAIPSEFQSQFGTIDRREVFRVKLDSKPPFPLLSKVRVVNPASPSNVTAMLIGGMSRWFQ